MRESDFPKITLVGKKKTRLYSDFKFSIKLYYLFLDCRIAQWNKILEKIKMRPLSEVPPGHFPTDIYHVRANLLIVLRPQFQHVGRELCSDINFACCPHLHIIHGHSGLYTHVSERKSGFHIWSLHLLNLHHQASLLKFSPDFFPESLWTSPVKFSEKTQTLPLSLHLPWPFCNIIYGSHFPSAQFFLICSWSSGQTL